MKILTKKGMKSAKGNHGEEEEDTTPSSNRTKDGKNNDKANTTRSKHSVTEKCRRNKINERFQTLRNLIPRTDQKGDTASFLFEVIEYVQYLQERVQKYEGSYQPGNSEAPKLMPWVNYRNNHWRAQSFPANPQALKNGTDTGPTYLGRFDENLLTDTSPMQANLCNPLVSHPGGDVPYKSMDQEKELVSRAIATSMPLQASMPVPVQNDSVFCDSIPTPASDECSSTTNSLNNQEFMIEGGTISISSAYSQVLLNLFTQAVETAGLDLSQATLSVQINLGKQAFKVMGLGTSIAKDATPLSSFGGNLSGDSKINKIPGASSNVIEISAPMLRSFDYTGNITSVCLKNIPLLAKLSLSHRGYYVGAG